MNVREYNMKYLKLNDEQYDRHIKLMNTKMSDWPEDLKAFLKKVGDQYGFSGDVIACVVADYVRGDSQLTNVPIR